VNDPARPVYHVVHQPAKFAEHSGLLPLATRLGGTILPFDFSWIRLQSRSWTAGHLLRRWGDWAARSTWNALVPGWDEARFLRAISPGRSIVHFWWAEFASPGRLARYHRRGARVVGTFHCSSRRQRDVLAGFDPARRYDFITVVSETQIPFFRDAGVSPDRLTVLHYGVDTDFFRPLQAERAVSDGRFRLLLVGDTERDHAFAASLFRALPPERFVCEVKTRTDNWHFYRDVPHLSLLPRLNDEELRAAYERADLLIMPVFDSTANTAVLESMACGTPVMVNRVGGVPEYVDSACNFLMEDRQQDDWASRLAELAAQPGIVKARRVAVRTWAETRFSWHVVVPKFLAYHRSLT
jgi:glycosyltransferase involved in cell wall biosynthesis